MAKPSEALINQNIRHFFTVCEERDKPDILRSALHAFRADRALIFVHRNETAERLAGKLAHHKVAVADLHGAYSKEDRKRAMDDFRGGKVRALIASDVAARGLDIKGVTHVFNYDVPSESKAYLHRVGRTARAGASGVAVSILTAQQGRILERLEQELGITMTEFYLRSGEVQEVAKDESPKAT
jgi:superfamily II DNA/RNA helicase